VHAQPSAAPEASIRDPLWRHLALLLGGSIAYESALIHHGLNLFDEGWAPHTAMRPHAGDVLARWLRTNYRIDHATPDYQLWLPRAPAERER
jgi:hypothetical protein